MVYTLKLKHPTPNLNHLTNYIQQCVDLTIWNKNSFKKVCVCGLKLIIHKDQTGFLSKRKLSSNIRTIIDILEYYEMHPEKQMMLIFLDAEKAFDNVNWEFMLSLLKRMGIQGTYFQAIKAIYTMQVAKIKVNGSLTGNIQIEHPPYYLF